MANESTATLVPSAPAGNGSNGNAAAPTVPVPKRAYNRKPASPVLNLDEREMRALSMILAGQFVHEGWARRIAAKVNACLPALPDFGIPPSD